MALLSQPTPNNASVGGEQLLENAEQKNAVVNYSDGHAEAKFRSHNGSLELDLNEDNLRDFFDAQKDIDSFLDSLGMQRGRVGDVMNSKNHNIDLRERPTDYNVDMYARSTRAQDMQDSELLAILNISSNTTMATETEKLGAYHHHHHHHNHSSPVVTFSEVAAEAEASALTIEEDDVFELESLEIVQVQGTNRRESLSSILEPTLMAPKTTQI